MLKMTPQEQINDLKAKGITFNGKYDEVKAADFLLNNTYYFKFKSYCKNFQQHETGEFQGQYIDVDFEHLVKLSTCDFLLRSFILRQTINLEHHLKIELNQKFTQNNRFHPIDSITEYLDGNPMLRSSLDKNRGHNSPYIKPLANATTQYAYWHLFELLTFGQLLHFYKFYIDKYTPDNQMNKRNYKYLININALRNSSAHNNCLLHSLVADDVYFEEIHGLEVVAEKIAGLSNGCLKICFVHDLCVLLEYCDNNIRSEAIKGYYKQELRDLVVKFNDFLALSGEHVELRRIIGDIVCTMEYYSS